MYRIIIAGSRNFNNYELLKENVNKILFELNITSKTNIEIISGGARGTDRLGEKYAKEFGYPLKIFPAEWSKYGKSAGLQRNMEMAIYANCADNAVLIAFWDGVSNGTKHMINTSLKLGLDVRTVMINEIEGNDK